MWILPDIGTQVLVFFPEGDHEHGVVAGCVYDEKHLPPAHSTDNPSKSIVYQTKNFRVEIIDEDGKETIQTFTRDGKVRFILSKKEGISVVNETGDIHVKCKELEINGEDSISFKAKKFNIESEGEINYTAKKTLKIACDKEIEVKGKNIKMSGSKGVATGGKQIAVEGNKVMGFDVHTMVIPAGNHTENVPLPHPFIGKLNDKLAKDVSIGDHKVAVKGSKAKNDSPTHNQLPGTIKFQKNPKNEGEVTGGTADKLKIDGKEACVIGSQVTTCNDVGAQNNSTVIAVGASMPMPVIINPKNAEKWKEDKAKENNKKPQFTTVKWGKTSAKEGEEVELSANVKDIDDGNMVTLQVFPEGKGPENGFAYAKFPLTLKGGSVSAKWSWHADSREPPPDQDPKFIFSAHSAWCNYKKSSGSLAVKLVRPEITKAEWQDADGNSASKGLAGDTLKLHAETKDMADGEGVRFCVYNSRTGEKVAEPAAKVDGSRADAEWTAKDTREAGDTDGLKYYFEAIAPRAKKMKSSDIEVKNPQVVSMEWEKSAVYYGDEVKLTIKTFEVSDFSPSCKLQLKNNAASEDKPVQEQDITIDKDELEIKIKSDFDMDSISKSAEGADFNVYAKITCDKMEIRQKEKTLLQIRTTGARR